MSSIDRALKKLRAARAVADQPSESQARIARVAVDRHVAADRGGGDGRSEPRRSIEFDFGALRDAGLFSPENQRLAEQYRVIKQPLLKKAAGFTADTGERANFIMVGSALSGEGKTFTCVNLSLSLAIEKDWEVLLIDVDCKNPQLSQLLGIQDQPGFLELLRDDTLSPEAQVFATNIDGLSVLPVGMRDEHSAELLASSRMKDLCAELAVTRRHRLVVFDSSPLLLTTEPSILATHVGQIVLVVRAGSTPQHAVKGALEKLDPARAVGLVLNRATEAGEVYSYGAYPYAYAQG